MPKPLIYVPVGVVSPSPRIQRELNNSQIQELVARHQSGRWDTHYPARNVIEDMASQIKTHGYHDVYIDLIRSDREREYLTNYQTITRYWESVGKNKPFYERIHTWHKISELETVWVITVFCIPDLRESTGMITTDILYPSEY